MNIHIDTRPNEASILHKLVNFNGKRVLEIGSGDGRMTWYYAQRAISVLAIDPNKDVIDRALEKQPANVHAQVDFLQTTIEDLVVPPGEPGFDVAMFTRSLC